jgi:benzoyl-CoA reductase/2-hydroxyglutaryl-CoA dehydratase subunit BcrC/BadD/HgdB
MSARLNEYISQLSEAAIHPRRTILNSMRETGKSAFGCFPIYTPEEIVYAAGFLPVGMWGGKTEIRFADQYLQGFCCSIMRSNMEYGIKGAYNILDGIVISTFCDTLKCVCENWKTAVPHIPLIAMVYPQNRRLAHALEYMKEEFRRVRNEVGMIRGVAISDEDLEYAFTIYEDYRAEMRTFVKAAAAHPCLINSRTRHLIIKAGYFMDKMKYTEIMRAINRELMALPKDEFNGLRVIMTGLIGEPVELLDILAENCIAVVADDLAHESRQFRTAARETGSAIEKMAYRIVDQRGDTFLYEEEKTKGEMLVRMSEENNADAIIVCMMKFCDPEEFEYPILKEVIDAAEIPLLYLETEQQLDSFEQMRTRIQSFKEMLK